MFRAQSSCLVAQIVMGQRAFFFLNELSSCVFQGDIGPQGFPGTPGDMGPKGEKVSLTWLGLWAVALPSGPLIHRGTVLSDVTRHLLFPGGPWHWGKRTPRTTRASGATRTLL